MLRKFFSGLIFNRPENFRFGTLSLKFFLEDFGSYAEKLHQSPPIEFESVNFESRGEDFLFPSWLALCLLSLALASLKTCPILFILSFLSPPLHTHLFLNLPPHHPYQQHWSPYFPFSIQFSFKNHLDFSCDFHFYNVTKAFQSAYFNRLKIKGANESCQTINVNLHF